MTSATLPRARGRKTGLALEAWIATDLRNVDCRDCHSPYSVLIHFIGDVRSASGKFTEPIECLKLGWEADISFRSFRTPTATTALALRLLSPNRDHAHEAIAC